MLKTTWKQNNLPTLWDIKKEGYNDGLATGIFGTLFILAIVFLLLNS